MACVAEHGLLLATLFRVALMGRWPLRGKGAIKESIPPPHHVQASRTTHTLPMARLEAVHWPQGARGGGGGGGGGGDREGDTRP